MEWSRRDILKGLGGLPIVGGIWWAGAASSLMNSKERSEILEQLNIQPSLPPAAQKILADLLQLQPGLARPFPLQTWFAPCQRWHTANYP